MTAYRAARLPRHHGPAGWNAILGPQGLARALDEDTTADIVIVGGGFAGLSAARRITQIEPTARVVVLEAGRIGDGAAGRNSGFMIDLPHDLASEDYAGAGDDRAVIRLNRRAIAFAQEVVSEYQIKPDFFDPSGKINAAASDAAMAHNESYAQHLASLDEASEMLDAQQMREITGSRHYRGGLYTKGTVMLQPAGYIRGLAAGLAGDGVDIFERSPVSGFSREGDVWQVQVGPNTLVAPKLILTVNGHLESFGIARDQLIHLFLFAALTPELDVDAQAKLGGQPRWSLTPSDPMGTSARRIDGPQGGNRILVRTAAAMRSSMEAKARDMRRATRVMQRKFDERFPQLKGLRPEHVWGGHLCLTRNSVAVAREVDKGVYTGCVQNGLGTAKGTLTGIAAAERALGQTSDITHFFDTEPNPTKLPPHPLRDLGGNIYLRTKEWRASHE